MLDPTAPSASIDRARHTADLIKTRASDVGRWANPANLARSWSGRAKLAAAYIPSGSRVLDLGAGNMELGNFLPPGCTYIPADIVSRCEGCLVADLNAGVFPEIEADCTTILGVLEYLHRPEQTLREAAEHAKRLIFSYVTFWHGSTEYRRGMGWVNDFRRADLDAMLTVSGWKIEAAQTLKLRWRTREYLMACSLA